MREDIVKPFLTQSQATWSRLSTRHRSFETLISLLTPNSDFTDDIKLSQTFKALPSFTTTSPPSKDYLSALSALMRCAVGTAIKREIDRQTGVFEPRTMTQAMADGVFADTHRLSAAPEMSCESPVFIGWYCN